jgi:DNA-binding transcriptional LysR family regulator
LLKKASELYGAREYARLPINRSSFTPSFERSSIGFPSIEINSVDAIETYVANGFGIGLTVSIPKTKMSPKVRSLPLTGFPNVIMGALWRGKPSLPMRTLLDELQARAASFKG